MTDNRKGDRFGNLMRMRIEANGVVHALIPYDGGERTWCGEVFDTLVVANTAGPLDCVECKRVLTAAFECQSSTSDEPDPIYSPDAVPLCFQCKAAGAYTKAEKDHWVKDAYETGKSEVLNRVRKWRDSATGGSRIALELLVSELESEPKQGPPAVDGPPGKGVMTECGRWHWNGRKWREVATP